MFHGFFFLPPPSDCQCAHCCSSAPSVKDLRTGAASFTDVKNMHRVDPPPQPTPITSSRPCHEIPANTCNSPTWHFPSFSQRCDVICPLLSPAHLQTPSPAVPSLVDGLRAAQISPQISNKTDSPPFAPRISECIYRDPLSSQPCYPLGSVEHDSPLHLLGALGPAARIIFREARCVAQLLHRDGVGHEAQGVE